MSIEPLLVIKLGGNQGVDFTAACQDVAYLAKQGKRLLLVHGGSAETNLLGNALGLPPRFITSPSGFTSRYTDRATLEVFSMAVNGKLNTLLVEKLRKLGVNALGLSGLDGGLIQAERKDAVQSVENGKRKLIRDDHTGKITHVNVNLLQTLLEAGYVPVIAPLAAGHSGEALNVDADRAAAFLAAGMKADLLILLTAVPGLMRSFPDESTIIERLTPARIPEALLLAQGRMKKKVLGAQEALQGGVRQVVIADGRISQPIHAALAGKGTVIA